jgi:hypothetical protein
MQAEHVTKLRAALQDGVVPERLLLERLTRAPEALTDEDAVRLVNEAHSANMIRWVAFAGFAWGGRPR